MGLPADPKNKAKAGESEELAFGGCLILTLSLTAMACLAFPIMRTFRESGVKVAITAILATGSIVCGLGAGLLRLLGIPLYKRRQNHRDNDLE